MSLPIICFSHLRWDFVFQRPHHLLTRFARQAPVFFVEEPDFGEISRPALIHRQVRGNVQVVLPLIPQATSSREVANLQRPLLANWIAASRIQKPLLWFYTPMAMGLVDTTEASAVVYDCMDELSGFQGASPLLRKREAELISKADIIFTGGPSLYEAKRGLHSEVHAFPSGVDVQHFAAARQPIPDPPDQYGIPHPRLGFYGVIDERLDRDLLLTVSKLRPDWHIVLLGPIAKVDPVLLPRAVNIHYLGAKDYQDLPKYLSNWDVAIMPFAQNDATRFISPTKTPEYLAGGKPVVSTPIADVVTIWGGSAGVIVADGPQEFVAAASRALQWTSNWRSGVDRRLESMSWDDMWKRMEKLTQRIVDQRALNVKNVGFKISRPLSSGHTHV